jgi:hypothetical protein
MHREIDLLLRQTLLKLSSEEPLPSNQRHRGRGILILIASGDDVLELNTQTWKSRL